MDSRPSIIERAFQLAKSGQCLTVDDIRAQLSRERYEMVPAYIRGMSLLTQLRGQITTARTSRPGPEAVAANSDAASDA
ncbi:MAG: hypothetical protein NW200_11150 [Hyphomonadaceae bacterium]|nr:hypothetical protein [Hyphomonadaceae bacterium]